MRARETSAKKYPVIDKNVFNATPKLHLMKKFIA